MGTRRPRHRLDHARVVQQSPRQGKLGRLLQAWRLSRLHALCRCAPRDRAQPCIGVLHIRRGIAVERQRLVEIKVDISLPIARQVVVLDGANSDDARHFVKLGLGQLGILGVSHRAGPPNRLIDKLVEQRHVAFARAARGPVAFLVAKAH